MTFYHARAITGGDETSHYWINHQRDDIAEEILRPFVNRQIISSTHGSKSALYNPSTAAFLQIYKTDDELTGSFSKQCEMLDLPAFAKNIVTDEFADEVRLLQSSPASRSLIQRSLATKSDTAFVIMKFGDKYLDSVFTGVMTPELRRAKLQAVRADGIQDSGRIDEQVLELIASSKLIVADMTGDRPNCYYEAGFAHALGKEMILTVRSDSEVHFDLAHYRFIRWETEDDLRKQLRKRIKAISTRTRSSGTGAA